MKIRKIKNVEIKPVDVGILTSPSGKSLDYFKDFIVDYLEEDEAGNVRSLLTDKEQLELLNCVADMWLILLILEGEPWSFDEANKLSGNIVCRHTEENKIKKVYERFRRDKKLKEIHEVYHS